MSGTKLKSPSGTWTRPTTARVREATINILASRLNNCSWLDLFSGSGVMGCEALQHGAETVVAVEKNAKIAAICRENLLSSSSCTSNKSLVKVLNRDVLTWLKKSPKSIQAKNKESEEFKGFDLIYIDPPYGSPLYQPVLRSLLTGRWIKETSIVICEHATELALKAPQPWKKIDKRVYGSSSLLFISPPEKYCGGIDSKH